jgi:hypothetical protein
MKIYEIMDKFKVMQSSPQGIEIASQNGTTIKLPPEQASAFTPDPQNPKSAVLNLSNASGSQPPAPAQGQQATGQPAPAQGQQATGQPAQGQPAPTPDQQATMGQPAPGQPQLPQVGAEIELADTTMGSPVQAETFNDSDLISPINRKHKHKNKPISGDPTGDFIDDVVDHKWEKNAGRSNRNVIQPEPIRESAELIAMLTIAGLR